MRLIILLIAVAPPVAVLVVQAFGWLTTPPQPEWSRELQKARERGPGALGVACGMVSLFAAGILGAVWWEIPRLPPRRFGLLIVATAALTFALWWVCVTLLRSTRAESRAWIVKEAERLGRCTACGYDLRTTPGQCPECGHRPGS